MQTRPPQATAWRRGFAYRQGKEKEVKQMEETVRAVRDWAQSMILNNLKEFKGELNLDTLLKKTGDASKVTTSFSTYGSRTLPSSGEKLDITLGKIKKYLYDLNSMAFSTDYDKLTYKPIRSNFYVVHKASAEAYSYDVKGMDPNNAVLIYGLGGPSTAAEEKKKADFFRAYLLACDRYVDYNTVVVTQPGTITPPNENGHPITYMMKQIQLGSVGSTARWTMAQLTTSTDEKFCLNIKIPKGSWAAVEGMRIPLFTAYASSK